jgi:DNA-binding transcriptional LysR family regulator
MSENWDEFRTAYQVARMGTVSGAAEVLGVHHATVIRHVDALETRVGVKLFQRHARGYTPTEAGEDLLKVAAATDDQFNQLVGRIKGHGADVSGELVVTTVAGLGGLLVPTLVRFQRENPDITVRYQSDERLYRLEYGEAHVAIRAGKKPDEPDNVVQPFMTIRMTLCAAPAYIAKYGLPNNEADLANHRFVAFDETSPKAPQNKWMKVAVPDSAKVFFAGEGEVVRKAIAGGVGIGFVPEWKRAKYPDLVDVLAPRPEWDATLWLVTHVDLHRTTKVQAFLKYLKHETRAWRDQ